MEDVALNCGVLEPVQLAVEQVDWLVGGIELVVVLLGGEEAHEVGVDGGEELLVFADWRPLAALLELLLAHDVV